MYRGPADCAVASHVGLLKLASAQNNAKQKSRLAYHCISTVWLPLCTDSLIACFSALSSHGESTYSPLAVYSNLEPC